MYYNTQTDKRWKNEVMTSDKWVDRLGRWGCLVTSLANIHQIHSNIIFTPDALNDILVSHGGYWFLSGKTTSENNASFLDWDNYETLLNVNHSIIYKYEPGFLIARVILQGGGHYINVLNKVKHGIICFDVWEGKTKLYRENEISKYIKITFKE